MNNSTPTHQPVPPPLIPVAQSACIGDRTNRATRTTASPTWSSKIRQCNASPLQPLPRGALSSVSHPPRGAQRQPSLLHWSPSPLILPTPPGRGFFWRKQHAGWAISEYCASIQYPSISLPQPLPVGAFERKQSHAGKTCFDPLRSPLLFAALSGFKSYACKPLFACAFPGFCYAFRLHPASLAQRFRRFAIVHPSGVASLTLLAVSLVHAGHSGIPVKGDGWQG